MSSRRGPLYRFDIDTETSPRPVVEPFFTPTTEWQDVHPDAILPPGLEIRMSLATGRNQARLPAKASTSTAPAAAKASARARWCGALVVLVAIAAVCFAIFVTPS